MPKPSDYTPARRRAMQAIMWAILLATVGLAALVGSANRRAGRVELSSQAISAGDVTVRLPQRWRAMPRGEDPRTVARATDNAPLEQARQVEVLFDTLETPVSPVQYLAEQFQLVVPYLAIEDSDDGTEAVVLSPVTVAGQPGVMVMIDGAQLGQGVPNLPPKEVYAAAVLPSQRAVVVRLRGIGRPDVTDRTLVKQIAEAITVQNEPGVSTARDAVTLPGGMSIAPPEGFAVVAQNDPLRTDRRLWPIVAPGGESAEQLEQRWATLEVVECLWPKPEGDADAHAAMQTLLLVRDPIWRDATITAEGPDTWRAEPLASASRGGGSVVAGAPAAAGSAGMATFPARAYLRTDPSGRALLAIFRGGYDESAGHDASFKSAWAALSGSIRFGAASVRTDALEAAGAAAAERMRKAGFESLVGERSEQWWLWTDASDRPHRAWSHLDFDVSSPGEVRAKTELRLRKGGGVITRVTGDVRHADAASHYRSDVTASAAQGSVSHSFQQSITLRDGQLSLTAKTVARPLGQWSASAPPQFVPGALLPLVMDELAGEAGPILLRAESFLGFEAVGAPQPLTILIRPVKPPSSRPAEGEAQPMRCVEAEVNGSGRVSRWYFRGTGEVERVELPGGMQRLSSNAKTIGFDFGKDPLMAP